MRSGIEEKRSTGDPEMNAMPFLLQILENEHDPNHSTQSINFPGLGKRGLALINYPVP